MRQLQNIKASEDMGLEYKPCAVVLRDGSKKDNVYVVDAQAYIDTWGVWPEDDNGKKFVRSEEVVSVCESPNRLPPEIADQIYEAGESGMGYCVFLLEFKNGLSQSYVTGNAVDFVQYPKGITANDIVRVKPHEGRETAVSCPEYYWCLIGRGKSGAGSEFFT